MLRGDNITTILLAVYEFSVRFSEIQSVENSGTELPMRGQYSRDPIGGEYLKRVERNSFRLKSHRLRLCLDMNATSSYRLAWVTNTLYNKLTHAAAV